LTLAARKRARTKGAQNCFLYCLVLTTVASAFVFKLIEVEAKFPFANSISEFSRSQGNRHCSPSLLMRRYQLLRLARNDDTDRFAATKQPDGQISKKLSSPREKKYSA
jgi:hypothetical protein